LLVSCRQPNPEWKGPYDGTTSDDNPMSTAGSETPESSDGFMTEGQSCNNDNMCPDGWACGPEGCQQGMEGMEGDPCTAAGNCQAPFGICSPEGTCQDGSEGDPCSENNDCMNPSGICGPLGACQDGGAGDPCNAPNRCAGGTMCTDEVCG
jgi:hypothetical protein